MSEPFLERLTRFTPDAAGLDRDALLFAAGRASARPNRGWMAAASMLAGTQVLSLVLLWPHPRLDSSGNRVAAARDELPVPAAAAEAGGADALASPGRWPVRKSLLEPVSDYRPPADVTFIESGPPLRAAGARGRALFLN